MMVKISAQGLVDILGREGICLSPYLDSVGVWTIGAGQTKSDGIDPQHSGNLTLEQWLISSRRRSDNTRMPSTT
jgi:lysozyme